MLIVALQHSGLAIKMFNSFPVPMSWLSIAGSTASYCKVTNAITFHLVSDKKVPLTKKIFTQILEIPNSPPFYKPSNIQIVYMFNEMGHQPPLTKISDIKQSGLPCI